MVITLLEKTIETIPDGTERLLHSDQGWQYQHKQYRRMLKRKGIRQSMSRKGNCSDNEFMEYFLVCSKARCFICKSSNP
ncbi:DDE-type integrase/transposase/recombinase [Anaeromassilibacillus sp. SJQ-1]|uniref:DDE-type integrase/transposase/recombinase n=1 Tax=Anaeromassilibacillus sp. SJQ-1 TaxID=3375419 RepID=UPI0009EBE433